MTYILRCLRPGWDVPSTGMMAHQFVMEFNRCYMHSLYRAYLIFYLEILLRGVLMRYIVLFTVTQTISRPAFVSRCGTTKCVITKRTGSLSFLCADVYNEFSSTTCAIWLDFFIAPHCDPAARIQTEREEKFWHHFLRSGECRGKWTISTSPSLDKQYISFRRRKWFAP